LAWGRYATAVAFMSRPRSVPRLLAEMAAQCGGTASFYDGAWTLHRDDKGGAACAAAKVH
jgi:hypothetical protein